MSRNLCHYWQNIFDESLKAASRWGVSVFSESSNFSRFTLFGSGLCGLGIDQEIPQA
jgi:hypothetical protein